MRVVHSTIRFPPARGGVETYVEAMVDGLHDAAWDVGVVTTDLSQHLPGMRRPLTAAELREDSRRGYPVRRVATRDIPGLAAYPLAPGIPRALDALAPDVVHAHCFYYPSVDGAAVYSRRRRRPLVVSPHLPAREGWKWSVYRRAMGKSLANADFVTTLTVFERELIQRSGLRLPRTALMPPVVEMPKVGGEIPQRAAAFVQGGSGYGLFMGRINDTKGADTLLDAAPLILKQHPEFRFVLAGPVSDHDRLRYQAQIDADKLTESVLLLGEVTDDERWALFRSASLHLFPSRYEAYGIVALEAMVSSTAVVAADSAAIPEVLEHGRLGALHVAGNPESLARESLRLLDDEQARAELVATALAHVQTKHTPAAQTERLAEIYQAARSRQVAR